MEGANSAASGGQGATNGIIGTGGAWLNYRIESDALFQHIPQNRPFQRIRCEESLTSTSVATNTRNYLLSNPQKLVVAGIKPAYQTFQNTDVTGTQTDNTSI